MITFGSVSHNNTCIWFFIIEAGELQDDATSEMDSKILHRTQSIFIRNLAPNITKQEVEAVSTSWMMIIVFTLFFMEDVTL